MINKLSGIQGKHWLCDKHRTINSQRITWSLVHEYSMDYNWSNSFVNNVADKQGQVAVQYGWAAVLLGITRTLFFYFGVNRFLRALWVVAGEICSRHYVTCEGCGFCS